MSVPPVSPVQLGLVARTIDRPRLVGLVVDFGALVMKLHDVATSVGATSCKLTDTAYNPTRPSVVLSTDKRRAINRTMGKASHQAFPLDLLRTASGHDQARAL